MTEHCEIPTPPVAASWRNAAFFEDVVAEDLKLPSEEFRILDVAIANANAKTAGYMSLIHRVTVNVELGPERRALTYIVKEKSDQVFGGEAVDLMMAFPKEIDVYSKLVPAFEHLWMDEGVKFGPRLFKTVSEPFTVIVMEDLTSAGFEMKICRDGLNLQQCEKVLEKLAKFHAASVAYYEQNGPYSDNFKDGLYCEGLITNFESYYTPLFNSYLQALAELNYPTHILDALRSWKGKVYATVCKLYRYDHTKFNVFNHGDIWINNILFSDNDLLLIDYQTPFYGSPSFDIINCIINSAALDFRTDKFDHLIEHYYKQLVSGLRTLNTKVAIPTHKQICDDVQAHGFLVFILAMEGLAMMLAMPDLEIDIELLSSEGPDGVEFRRKLFSTAPFVKTMEKLVPFMWERGFLKVAE